MFKWDERQFFVKIYYSLHEFILLLALGLLLVSEEGGPAFTARTLHPRRSWQPLGPEPTRYVMLDLGPRLCLSNTTASKGRHCAA